MSRIKEKSGGSVFVWQVRSLISSKDSLIKSKKILDVLLTFSLCFSRSLFSETMA